MIDRLAKIQLSIFAVITVITLSVMAIFICVCPPRSASEPTA